MESRIPLPTDNIYKFYALFGLLLIIFSLGAFLYVIRSANEIVYASVPELEGLQQIEKPSPVEAARIALLKRKLEVTKADKETYIQALAVFIMLGTGALLFGFYKWEKEVQPLLDRTTKAQAEIAELQLLKLRRELGFEHPVNSLPAAPAAAISQATTPPQDIPELRPTVRDQIK